MSSFFGGSKVVTGEVRRLPASTFPELVTRYYNVPVPIPMTRAAFHQLSEDERKKVKDTPYICSCSFNADPAKRCDANAIAMVLACFDIDDGDIAVKLHEAPQVISEALFPWNFVAHTTISHLPDSPRLRIVVEVKDCPPHLHGRIIDLIARRLGIPEGWKGSRESRVVSQPMFRPAAFKDEKFEAILASRTNGIALEEADLPDPADELDELTGERRYAGSFTGEEDLGLAYLPIPGIEVEDIREPLFEIDADCDYKVWTNVIAGVRHQFRDEESAREAFELLDEWSSQGSKYKEGEVWAKWRSFQPDPANKAPNTLRTLFHFAMKEGWTGGKLAAQFKGDIAAWIESTDDGDLLMQEGPVKIANMPLRSEVIQDSLVRLLQARIKKATTTLVDKRSIMLEIAKERKRDRADKNKAMQNGNMPGWLRPVCYVGSAHVFHHFGTGVSLTPAAFDRMYNIELMPKDGAEAPANGKPVVAASDFATNVIDIPKVDDTIYCPLHAGEDPYIKLDGKTYLNTYNPLSVPVADPEHSDEAGALITEHSEKLVGKKYSPVFLDSLAAMVQYPGRKFPWSSLVQSGEGAGKGMLGDILSAVLGKINVQMVSSEVMRSQWNDWWPKGQVNFLNEVHMPGEQRERVMNSLKPLITDPIITINKRNTSAATQVPNWTNCIAFTNFHDATHLKASDRRWFVICSPLQTKEQIQALKDSGHFDRLEILKGEWAGALRYWLLHRKIADDFPWQGPAPMTEWRDAVVEESKNPLQIAIEDALEEDDPAFAEDIVSLRHLTDAMPRHLLGHAAKVTHYLTLLGFERHNSPERFSVGGVKTAVWVRRSLWDQGLGSPPDILRARLEARGDLSL